MANKNWGKDRAELRCYREAKSDERLFILPLGFKDGADVFGSGFFLRQEGREASWLDERSGQIRIKKGTTKWKTVKKRVCSKKRKCSPA